MKKNLPLLLLFGIIALGLFLRAYKIFDNYYFSGELGKEMLYIREFIIAKTLPLVGMPTSHEWLSYGPLYYWIMMPVFIAFKGNPFILFWVAWAVAGVGLVLNYCVIKKIADKNLALISTSIMALSPLLIWQTRLSKLHVFFWILMPLFTLFTYYLWNGHKKWLIPAGILFGVMFSFHFSQIPILGVILILFFIRKEASGKRGIYNFRDVLKFFAGVLVPNITYIWKDLNIALWVPYRVLNVENKNPAGTLQLLNEYLGKNVFWDNKLWVIGFILFAVIFSHYVYLNKKNLKKEFLPFYLISSVGLMLAANILHGAPPVHYFLPVFTTVPILFAIYLSKIKYWPILLIGISVFNFIAFNKDPLFYLKFSGNSPNMDIVSYETQNNIVSFVASSSKGKEVSIKRVGPYDYFPENYSQNYKYLLLYKGISVIDNSPNLYTIIESEKGVYVQK